ncbi:carboxypeptidase-like regulatory domain-containing protein [Nibrella viscosa]|uniref:Carboxypeptidase-like regulatory domain-containing protein n=1 Tax=Nibrella viscosa TaxID=1084524 RepID=A0ABP8L3W3_9BACT
MKKRTLLLAFVLLSLTGFGQSLTQTIKGKIIDAQSGSGLPGASVVLVGTNPPKGSATDADGEFQLTNVPVGRQALRVTYVGYREQEIPNILVTSGKEVVLQISLQEEVITGQEVIVKAKRDKNLLNNEFGTLSARTFDVEQIRRFAGSRNDPARMAASFAGVVGNNDARNDIVVRGNSPLGLLWRLEGVDIPNPSHYGSLGATGGPVSMLNNNTLAKSDFFTGAFPAMYGNAQSGVFDLQLRNGNAGKREYTGQMGFNGFELGAEGPIVPGKKATYLINYRYSVLGAVKLLGLNFGTGSAVPQYQDLTFKFDLPTGRTGSRFTLFGVGGLSRIDMKANPEDTTNLYGDPYRSTFNTAKMGVTGLSYTHYFNDRTYLKATVAASGSAFYVVEDTLNAERVAHPYFRDGSHQERLTALVQLNKKYSARHSVSAGAYFHQLFFTYADSVFLHQQAFRKLHDVKGNTSLMQAYVQWQFKPSNHLTLNSGLHGSLFALNNSTVLEPRFGARYEINPRQTVSFSAGLNSLLPPMQIYFYRTRLSDNEYIQTNRNLGFTRSFQSVAGYERTVGDNIRLKAETYFQYLYNVPVELRASSASAVNVGADFSTPNVDSLVNKGLGRNYGLELTAERSFSNGYYFLITTSLYDSKYQGSDKVWRNTAFNGNYVANVLAGKEFQLSERNTLSFDTRITLAGGRRYTPINLEASRRAGETRVYADQAYEAKFRDYFRTDFKITFRRNGSRVTQEWFVDFQNIFNTKNLFLQYYDNRSQRIRTAYQLGFFPNFNYRIEF